MTSKDNKTKVNNEAAQNEVKLKESSRRRTYRIVSIVTVIVVALAAVGINILMYFAADEFNLNIDVSNRKLYSVSDESKKIIDGLDTDVYIYSLYKTGSEDAYVTPLLKNYDAYSDKVHFENVDPTLTPGFTTKYDPDGNGIATGSVIVTNADASLYKVLTVYDMYSFSSDYTSIYSFRAEQRITTAIKYIMTGKTYGLRFLTGHDEDSLSTLGTLATDLAGLGYDISVYDASTTEKLDPAYDTLIVAAPKSDLSSEEYENIKSFLTEGGSAVFLLSYSFVDNSGTNQIVRDDLDNFNSLLMMYNVSVNRNLIIGGNDKYIYGNQLSLIPTMYQHGITNSIISAGETQLMADCSSIKITDSSTAAGLIWTDSETWAKDLTGNVITVEKNSEDETGPFIIGAVAMAGESKIAVYSSTSFVRSTSTGIGRAGNRDLFVNTLSVLAKEDDTVNVEAKSLEAGSMEFSGNSQATLMEILVIAVIPAAIMIAGIIVWVKRKRR